MASSCQDTVVLSYFDSLLRESDVRLLDGANWINDKIIGFYFEYLEREVFSDYNDQVCFITPDVTQFIKIYNGSEVNMFLEPLNLSKKELVLLAVNNNASSEASGGTHWSLLVYVRKENIFHTLDSCHSMNLLPSQQCARKITPFLNVPSQPKVSELPKCPQQSNSYDCGIFMLLFAETVCSHHLQHCSLEKTIYTIDSAMCAQFRTTCQQLIYKLRTT